jgi:hypothetical protein
VIDRDACGRQRRGAIEIDDLAMMEQGKTIAARLANATERGCAARL